MVPQPNRTDAETFDRALVTAALDVFANPKRVLQQEEDARDDVAHQGLRAKADGDPEDPKPGEQRPDIEPQYLQRGDGPSYHDKDRMAQQRQQCPKSRDRARYGLVRFTRIDGSRHLFVNDGADRGPQDPSC